MWKIQIIIRKNFAPLNESSPLTRSSYHARQQTESGEQNAVSNAASISI
ncbi:MAG: hypothetical protein M3R14_16875 [Acidobacteriota bacterium]|nr:hypothetical protein [Acidobacteriota bacterium]